MNDENRRHELSHFLRTRRARLSPDQVGLPAVGRRRTPGLRREEVAELAGVGISWYTWLEQGRAINASASVLESLARALQLSADERTYLFLLAHGEAPSPQSWTPNNDVAEGVDAATQHILDALEYCPAYVTNTRWDIVAWNKASRLVFVDYTRLSGRDRNAIWFTFMHPIARQRYVHWESAAKGTLELFRVSTAHHMGEVWFMTFVADLARASPEFATWWPDSDVRGTPQGGKAISHPVVGRLDLQPTVMQIASTPHLWMLVYTPMPTTDTLIRLQRLMEQSLAL